MSSARPMLWFRTDMRCPCGAPLVFVEGSDHVWLGCDSCVRYVRLERRQAARYVDYRAGVFRWRDLMEHLYGLYTARAAP